MATGSVLQEPRIVFITMNNVTITDNGTTALDLASYIPSGYGLWSVNVTIASGGFFYQLPWMNSSGASTRVEMAPISSIQSTKIAIRDFVGGWGTTTLYITAFLKHN